MVIPICEKNNNEYCLTMNYQTLGLIFYKKNDFTKAINYFSISLKLAIKRNSWLNIQESALLLSNAYEKNNNHKQALSA